MNEVTLGATGITTPQNAFGALPLQRCSEEEAVELLRHAYAGGMTFFDTARAYSNSEHRVGLALGDVRESVFIATKTMARCPDDFWRDLETSLETLGTDYVDLYQLHCVPQCYRPDDGTGMHECLVEAKRQGMIRHIGITAHLIAVAEEIAESGLYETLQFPFSYLATERDVALVESCARHNVGFIAMKGLAGGLITNSRAAMAFMTQYPSVLPIWGIQRPEELDQWLSYMEDTPTVTPEMEAFYAAEREALAGNFCRGCGYCAPCSAGIDIKQCARMSLMVRRAPSETWLSPHWQAEMAKINDCTECGMCMTRCPYQLEIPRLLRKNLADYEEILAGRMRV
ncbi:aldo/keto reductase [Adlercreutzia equolifaciens]|uniref:aldo/keto reductase n=1 Tax=Adlercreutzia equolifaciens TaxID=446660 RepID=UPI0023AFDEAE|nr:aldo/keto reductase [Adlercreutzia equolifaciens]MDE8702097.1 aldo/keto reductase [Adlercreutzia equolifaciens]